MVYRCLTVKVKMGGTSSYQCSSKVKPSMLIVEFSFSGVVTVVCKFVVLDQKSQVTQFALIKFRGITWVTKITKDG